MRYHMKFQPMPDKDILELSQNELNLLDTIPVNAPTFTRNAVEGEWLEELGDLTLEAKKHTNN